MTPHTPKFWFQPKWLSILLNYRWMAMFGRVLVPFGLDPNNYKPIVEHEEEHLEEEGELGMVRTALLYIFHREFRLYFEARGFAREYWETDERYRDDDYEEFAKDLSSVSYLWAARSLDEAKRALDWAIRTKKAGGIN